MKLKLITMDNHEVVSEEAWSEGQQKAFEKYLAPKLIQGTMYQWIPE